MDLKILMYKTTTKMAMMMIGIATSWNQIASVFEGCFEGLSKDLVKQAASK
jgi:hypothetical protein